MNDSATQPVNQMTHADTVHVDNPVVVRVLPAELPARNVLAAAHAADAPVDDAPDDDAPAEVDVTAGEVPPKHASPTRNPGRVSTRRSVRKSEGLRREPQQARGHKRIDRLLDAADALFAKVGFDAVSTNAIARKARTSIGSLYQFFPNKEALLHALAERYLAELRSLHAKVFVVENAGLPIEDLLWLVVRSLADFHQQHPGFQPLFHGSSTSRHLAAAERSLSSECYVQVEAMLAHRLPRLTQERRRLIAMINVEVTKALMPMSETGDAAHRELVLNEIHAMLLARNRQLIEEAGPLEESGPKPPADSVN